MPTGFESLEEIVIFIVNINKGIPNLKPVATVMCGVEYHSMSPEAATRTI